ncbi:hypothetical protein O3794_02760 [Gemella sanguinis]|uniref:hypothetical protein n=1 Tax=Gemella sanguinis TaxID=84135 RepID=UPI00352ECE50
MTEQEIKKAREIRNAKDRERFATNEEAKAKKKYRTYKSIAFSFVNIAKKEHLEELKEKIKSTEKNQK